MLPSEAETRKSSPGSARLSLCACELFSLSDIYKSLPVDMCLLPRSVVRIEEVCLERTKSQLLLLAPWPGFLGTCLFGKADPGEKGYPEADEVLN